VAHEQVIKPASSILTGPSVQLAWIFSTRIRFSTEPGASVFTGDLLTFQHWHCELAAALGHVAGFPGLGLLRRLRPASEASADDAPVRDRSG